MDAYIKDPEIVFSAAFIQRVAEAEKAGWPGERRDLQAITFYCWLRSKMDRRVYYEVLLEWMEQL